VWVVWKRRLAIAAGVLVGLAAIGVGAYFLVDAIRDDGETEPPPPAPRIVVHTERPQPEAAQDLGFPEFATKNTTRVAGADVAADAAAVALAVYPSTGGVPGPDAVTLVDSRDWQSGVAAASLAGPPVGAPILVSEGDDLPDLTTDALEALGPGGSASTKGAQVFQIGDAAAPSGVDSERVRGDSAAAIAAEVDKLRDELTGEEPDNVLLVGSQRPEYAMPAAGWAARSGDPVLFVGKDSVPEPTLDALKRHEDASLYALGPPSTISDKALKEVKDAASPVVRIGDSDPVQNAIDFARYVDGNFGWNITDPGHGLVIASDREPLDAAAAAPLGAVARHRRSAAGAGVAAGIHAGHQARLRGRPDACGLQPRVDHRRPADDLGRVPVSGRRSRRGGPGKVRHRRERPAASAEAEAARPIPGQPGLADQGTAKAVTETRGQRR
jgi:hypothetical protein